MWLEGAATVNDKSDRPALSAQEVMVEAGLNWEVEKRPAYFRDSEGNFNCVPNHFVVTRSDDLSPLGIVGKGYELFQNRELFDFIETFLSITKSKLDTCGFIDNGAMIWATAVAETQEFLPGDPSQEYFLISNNHDGNRGVQVGFMYSRLVCSNALLSSLKKSDHYSVRHVPSLRYYTNAILDLMSAHRAHSKEFAEIMKTLIQKPLPLETIKDLTEKLTRSRKSSRLELLDFSDDEVSDTWTPGEPYAKILDLVDHGLGTEIPGVKGTAYGFVQAVIEYVDHHRIVRKGNRSEAEAKFKAALFGQGAFMKKKAIELALAA
ncbi:MAG: DUF932 domain-containing protein [Deltaproteobacteria bacterium]|nr:DUF932 domain-containing protein [Deltaproteobacteria bacterium]